MSLHLLGEGKLFLLLRELDRLEAERVREGRCVHCGGALHRARYRRKPRGAAIELAEELCWRESFCCAVCRRRARPGSVLFLGRRVYVGAAVVLASLLEHGVAAHRMAKLRAWMGPVSGRTVKRWRQWWRETLPRTAFWKAARGCFARPVDGSALPGSLWKQFEGEAQQRLEGMLGFLRPLSASDPVQ